MSDDASESAANETTANETSAPVVCIRCQRIEVSPPLTWTVNVEHGRVTYVCAECSRDDIRGIESKLDPEWW